jgi:4-hydroxy-tetrahydrodipicolinate reductase
MIFLFLPKETHMNKPIPVVISGMPGKMATEFAAHASKNPDFRLLTHALSGESGELGPLHDHLRLGHMELIRPSAWQATLIAMREAYPSMIIVDFSTPDSALPNAQIFAEFGIPFVMGTTMPPESKTAIGKLVKEHELLAVVAPNMSGPVVLFQAMLERAAEEFPGVLGDCVLSITESHQVGKKDTSGTARAMMASFTKLGSHAFGAPFTEADIVKIRDPHDQLELGIHQIYLDGHGWHRYELDSSRENIHLELVHNVNGRSTYAEGAIKAVRFLAGKWHERTHAGETFTTHSPGHVFSMIDVLRNE